MVYLGGIKTKKVIVTIFLAVTLMLAFQSSLPVGSSTIETSSETQLPKDWPVVYVHPSNVTASIGENLTVSVVIYRLTDGYDTDPETGLNAPLGNLYGFDIEFSWNPSILQYVDHTVTVPVEDYPTPTQPSPYPGILHEPTIWIKDEINESGGIPDAMNPETRGWFAYVSMLPAAAFNGNGTAFTITFKVIDTGTSQLELLYVELADINGEPILFHKSDGFFASPGAVRRPDLSISSPDISFSKSNPSEGESVTISASIHNNGEINVENVTVQFFDGTILIGEEQISHISHHTKGSASMCWTTEDEGFHLIKIVADPYNAVTEADEENNEATRSLLVGEIPYPGGIVLNGSAAPNETVIGCQVTVEGYAWYNTTYGTGQPVAGAEVTIEIEGWTQETVHTNKEGDYKTAITAPYTPGNYTIIVTVTDFTFWESIEISLAVNQQEGIDLTLSHYDISFTSSHPTENENVTLTATIHNVGTEKATTVLVTFYDYGKLLGNETLSLIPAGQNRDADIIWNATSWGWHRITVVIDPLNTVQEFNEENNEAAEYVYVYPSLPDLTPTEINFSDSTPVVDQIITISTTVKNIGGVDANDVLVGFYDGNQSLGNTTISWIPGKGGSRTASIEHSFLIEGSPLICAITDPHDQLEEADEQNNQYCARRGIYVHNPQPDLTLSSSDITFSNSTPTIGQVVTIYATIHNTGEADAYNVTVEIFDWDSRIYRPINIPLIAESQQETVEVQWNATPPMWHRIKAAADGNNTISEADENNNVASRYIYVLAPDLSIHSEDIVFSNTNPQLGENVTIFATVHNIGDAGVRNVTTLFYLDDDPIAPPQMISFLPSGKSQTLSAVWNATGLGSHVVKVNTTCESPEYSAENNEATRAIIVGTRDLAVLQVTSLKTVVGEGYCTNISVTIENQGDITENLSVTVHLDRDITVLGDEITIGPQDHTLVSGNSTTLIIRWNTTGVAKGNYTITGNVTILLGETDTTDNTLTDGTILVTIPGDVDGDRDVDLYDVVKICIVYGSKKGDPNYVPNRDINCDGKINIYDLVIACAHYGQKDP